MKNDSMRQQNRIFRLGLLVLLVWLMRVTSSAGAAPQQTGAGEKNQPVALPAAKEELLTEVAPSFDKVGEASWVLGDAGHEHYAYAAKRGKKWLMVTDGKEGPEFLEVNSPRFSADGQHFAYRAVTQRSGTGDREFVRMVMVVDVQNGPEFEEVGPAVFSRDAQHVAYRGKRTPRTESREVLMLDGKEIKESEYASRLNLEMTREFDYEGQAVFSRDGCHWAYRARLKKNKEIVLLDGQEGSEFEEITNLVFSPDSRHFAYRAKRKKNQEVILLDGKETTEFDAVMKPVFSPDSRLLGYFAKREKKWRMVVDGQEGPELESGAIYGSYPLLYGPLFSPDGQHVSLLQLRGEHKFGGASWDALEIRDGKPDGAHHFGFTGNSAGLESLMFSPDGQRLAYILWGIPGTSGTAEGNQRVVVDGIEGKPYDSRGMYLFFFSADSRHFAYAVLRFLHNKSTVVIDGQEGKLYDDVMIGGGFRDVANGSDSSQHAFIYVARDGRKFYRVTQPVP